VSAFPPLADFGPRIMICGTSNTGKSTLAHAIGRAADLTVVHLDQLRFLPHTDWQDRPEAEFKALHDDAILGERWVMEGNYSRHFPQRLARATGIILVSDNRWANLARYVRRTLFEKERIGNLEGNRDSLKWDMVHWLLVRAPRNVARYRSVLPNVGLPYLQLGSMRDINALYAAWRLTRPR
jgi:adenylate kinase family enzyme